MSGAEEFSNDILAAMAPEDIERLRPHIRRVELAAGQVLYEPGDTLDRVYFPETGMISLITAMGDGQEIENTTRGRDGGIGYIEACGTGIMFSRVRVQIKGDFWTIAACKYREVYEESQDLRSQIQRRIEYLLAEARQTTACRATHPASDRLARTLLECHHHTGDLRLALTQEYLGGLIGVGRTTVTHTASDLQAQQLIRYSRGVVILTNLKGLKQRACECYQVLRDARDHLIHQGAGMLAIAACW